MGPPCGARRRERSPRLAFRPTMDKICVVVFLIVLGTLTPEAWPVAYVP
jgi:hypothetical protein